LITRTNQNGIELHKAQVVYERFVPTILWKIAKA